MSLAQESLGLGHESRKELKNSTAGSPVAPWQDKKAPGLGMMCMALIPAVRPALST